MTQIKQVSKEISAPEGTQYFSNEDGNALVESVNTFKVPTFQEKELKEITQEQYEKILEKSHSHDEDEKDKDEKDKELK